MGKRDFEVEAAVDPAKEYFRDEAVSGGIHRHQPGDRSTEICEEWRDVLYRLRCTNDIGFIRQCN